MSETGYSHSALTRDKKRLEELKKSRGLIDIEISTLALELRRIRSQPINPALRIIFHLTIASAISVSLVGLFSLIDIRITLETSIIGLLTGIISIFFLLQQFSTNETRWQKDVEKNLHRLELRRASIEGQILELESIQSCLF
jgi:hypothetical protein